MLRLIPLLLLVGVCLGCGSSAFDSVQAPLMRSVAPKSEDSKVGFAARAGTNSPSDKPADDLATDNRKIIYTASLFVVVEDFDGVEQSVSELVKKYGGFIASANVSLNEGSERSGTWTVRIPVVSFESFLDSTGNLGVPERREQQGQDVTEEFVDLEARIRSKKKLEERILELLADNKGEIKDVIEVERELSRVRTEIEQMEGRMRYLVDRTDLTTVTLSVREQQNYVPPQAPGLGSQIASTWHNSTATILNVAQNLLLALVACVPWFVLASVAIVPWWMWRRRA